MRPFGTNRMLLLVFAATLWAGTAAGQTGNPSATSTIVPDANIPIMPLPDRFMDETEYILGSGEQSVRVPAVIFLERGENGYGIDAAYRQTEAWSGFQGHLSRVWRGRLEAGVGFGSFNSRLPWSITIPTITFTFPMLGEMELRNVTPFLSWNAIRPGDRNPFHLLLTGSWTHQRGKGTWTTLTNRLPAWMPAEMVDPEQEGLYAFHRSDVDLQGSYLHLSPLLSTRHSFAGRFQLLPWLRWNYVRGSHSHGGTGTDSTARRHSVDSNSHHFLSLGAALELQATPGHAFVITPTVNYRETTPCFMFGREFDRFELSVSWVISDGD